MSEKNKSIIGIMLIITVLAGAFFYWGVRIYIKIMDAKIIDTANRTTLLIDHVIQNTQGIYDIHIKTILDSKTLITAFNDRDRERLYQITLPIHNRLKIQYKYYSNMHFHLPDGRSFLRMHKPDEFGDDLRKIRPIIMSVHETKTHQHAYEIGKHGIFYRLAYPVFYNQVYIGALEVGIRVEETARNIEKFLEVKVARFIDDKNLNTAFRNYRAQKEITSQNQYINAYSHHDFFHGIVSSFDFKRPEPQRVRDGGNHFVLFQAGELRNYKNSTIAGFLVAQNITGEMNGFYTFIRNSLLLFFVLLGCAHIVLHFSFGAMVEKIIELNRTLEARVRNRTKTLEELNKDVLHANAELNQVINMAADGMRIIDKNYNVLRVNETFVKLMGKSKDALENKPCHEWFKGVLCFTPQCTLQRILNGEERIEIDVERQVEGGEYRSFMLTATPYKSLTGEILGVVENFKDITDRKRAIQTIEEKEQYLDAVLSTVQTGVIVTDLDAPRIINANRYAAKLIGCSRKDLINARQEIYFDIDKTWISKAVGPVRNLIVEDCRLKTEEGETLVVRLAIAPVKIKGETYLVQSFSDITDIKKLLDKQAVDIHKAKSIMAIVNDEIPGSAYIENRCRIFAGAISVPCNAEGGDHFFVRHLKKNNADGSESLFSIKDQSGHEVNCILRSIYTDLIHNAALHHLGVRSPGELTAQLNNELCRAPFFEPDDFFTSINARLDHDTLMLEYVSSGHPPFLLIRDNCVYSYPESPSESYLPIPFIAGLDFNESSLQLEEDDQLIFYTDGLIEMPLKQTGRILDMADLKEITQSIVQAYSETHLHPPTVSELMEKLLSHICELSGESVTIGREDAPAENTSPDDITLLGIELESLSETEQQTFFFQTTEEISEHILTLHETIFKNKNATAFSHTKERVRMVLEEGIMNSWKHGNKRDPEKPIIVKWQFRNDLTIAIEDQGDGFDFQNLSDPTGRANILKTSGRGIFIIYHSADNLQFNNNGSSFITAFKRNSLSQEIKQKRINPVKIWQDTP